jgi:tetratricopeptide (TPR) repeat protein
VKSIITNLCILLCAALLMQGFQCKSSDMTTAGIAINSGDWNKAEEYLEKEVQKNPTNGEAWFELGQVREKKQNYTGMMAAFAESRKYVKDRTTLDKMAFLEQKVWIGDYNDAIQLYNDAIAADDDAKRAKKMRDAIDKMKSAITIRPANTESYSVLAQMYESVGDTAQAVTTLEQYVTMQRDAVSLLTEKNVMLDADRSEVQRAFGNPTSVKGAVNGNDSVMTDYYKSLNGKETYMYYAQNGGSFKLAGVRVNPPSTWLDGEKERFTTLNTQSYSYLAYLHFNKGDYTRSMELLNTVTRLRPATEDILQMQSQILDKTGKRDEAMQSVADLAAKYPDNKAYLVQYGSVLVNSGKYDEAIAQFDKALVIDPQYDVALYNIAAAYKNKAGTIQLEEKSKMDADSKYQEKSDRYVPLLDKAGVYFERYRALPGKEGEFPVVEQLMNIYQVTRNEQKIKRLVGELEGLEPLYQSNRRYYELLGQIYGKLGRTDKAKEAFEKADKLR